MNLRRTRERLGMSQPQLATELGIPPNTWARWERGEMPVKHPRILELALERLLIRHRRRVARRDSEGVG